MQLFLVTFYLSLSLSHFSGFSFFRSLIILSTPLLFIFLSSNLMDISSANMTSKVAEKLPSLHLNSLNGPRQTQWLAEELEGYLRLSLGIGSLKVDQSVKAVLNLIKDGQKEEIDEKKPELIAHVERVHSMYKSLAEKYDHLTEEVNAQMENTAVSSSDHSPGSLSVTPTQKVSLGKSDNQAIAFNLSPGSGHGSSDFSDKGGSEISLSASDSESEAFYSVANKTSDLRVNLQENEGYTTLLRRVTKYEEELKESNRKLCFANEEISKFMGELEKMRGFSKLVDDLQDELELAQSEITIRDGDLETEKTIVLKLKGEVAQYEAIIKTEKRLVLELKERILGHEADAYEREQEIKKLNIALFDTQRIHSLEKAKLDCDLSIMSEQLTLINARAEESKMQIGFLENEIKKCEAEKMKMESIYESQHIRACAEIGKLKTDIFERDGLAEALNKEFDKLKLKFDMLGAEKDGLNAKVQTLEAEISSRNNVMRELELKFNRSCIDCMDLMSGSDRMNKLVDELRVRLVELEREVERQRVVISERGEEKREAIRQLCFSIEHYRDNYQELKKAVVGHRRASVLAS